MGKSFKEMMCGNGGGDPVDEEVRKSEAFTRAILNTVIDGIITIGEDGIILGVNPAVQKIFGYTEEELVGNKVNTLMPEPYRTEHDTYLKNYLTTGVKKIIGLGREVRGRRKDGTEFPLDLAVSEMWVGGKRMFVGILRDISDKKLLERQKNDFYAMVTHDIKSPLTVILGYAEFLLDMKKEELPNDVLDMVEGIQENGRKIAHMVEDFLTISRLESEWIPVSPNKEDMASVLYSVYSDFLPQAEKKRIDFTLDENKYLPPLFVDKRYITRAIGNIVQNAVKYTPEGGRVTIGAHFMPGGQDAVVITVSDTGPGIPKQDRGKIFEKYYRSKGTSGAKGSGLGLAIAKTIVEAHCGRIELESEPGKGSTFRLVLPLRACERKKTAV